MPRKKEQETIFFQTFIGAYKGIKFESSELEPLTEKMKKWVREYKIEGAEHCKRFLNTSVSAGCYKGTPFVLCDENGSVVGAGYIPTKASDKMGINFIYMEKL